MAAGREREGARDAQGQVEGGKPTPGQGQQQGGDV